ncbi:hypothetical protein D3C72_1196170 [compost metagenome]
MAVQSASVSPRAYTARSSMRGVSPRVLETAASRWSRPLSPRKASIDCRSSTGTKPSAVSSALPSLSATICRRTSSSRMVRWCTLPRLARRATRSNDGPSPSVTTGRRRRVSSSVVICNHNVKVLAAADSSVWGSGSTVARTLAVTTLRFSPVVTEIWLRLGLVTPWARQVRWASSMSRSRSRASRCGCLTPMPSASRTTGLRMRAQAARAQSSRCSMNAGALFLVKVVKAREAGPAPGLATGPYCRSSGGPPRPARVRSRRRCRRWTG